jgi:plasmid stabilization system protein ParE
MSLPVRLTRDTEADLLEAFTWYEEQQPGLGRRFLNDVETTVERIAERPKMLAVVRGATRKALLHTYPYGIYYQIREDAILIFACIHGSRSAKTWRRRLN